MDAGGREEVSAGGTVVDPVINSGGTELLFAGGFGNNDVVAGGTELVLAGGSAFGAAVVAGAEVVFAGGSTTGTRVEDTGSQVLSSGGVALSTTLRFGGAQYGCTRARRSARPRTPSAPR